MSYSIGRNKSAQNFVSFIGTVGVPNRYGGFEAFLEHCAPIVAQRHQVLVTCWAGAYQEPRSANFRGVELLYLKTPANGIKSILHDLLAFFSVFGRSRNIVVLGVSGAIWFPLFRLLCDLTGKRLIVNIDGVEWKRGKFSPLKQRMLKYFDWLSQTFAHRIVFDNQALSPYVRDRAKTKARCIAYSGDHVIRMPQTSRSGALTVCRIEPENNIHMLIEGYLTSSAEGAYTIIGNWQSNAYARDLYARYESNPRLRLKDPVYDPAALALERESCAIYLHGHSVGGTNPSLVEMLFYDCEILCFDVQFHRETAGICAKYFADMEALVAQLNTPENISTPLRAERTKLRVQYTAENISRAYEELFK